jgi:large subunit ribosomal protein L17
MRHRKRGRKLGRNPNHQRALLRSLASALILTEREPKEKEENKPKVRGRIITTLQKAKEVRPLVERCVTIARRVTAHRKAAEGLAATAPRHSDQWRAWRRSAQWHQWSQAIAPVVAARRRVLRLLGNKQAVRILFEKLAERFADREGGYTRVLHLAKPRLGDAAPRAVLEFVGARDRQRKKAPKPAIEPEPAPEPAESEAPQTPETPS